MPNLLKKEKSPYLKQHENNPVDWYAWNKESSSSKKFLANKIGRTPFKTSIRNTVIAARFPMCRNTLVAPVEPEPNERISIPLTIFPAK